MVKKQSINVLFFVFGNTSTVCRKMPHFYVSIVLAFTSSTQGLTTTPAPITLTGSSVTTS